VRLELGVWCGRLQVRVLGKPELQGRVRVVGMRSPP
jgi:hypothetical protein